MSFNELARNFLEGVNINTSQTETVSESKKSVSGSVKVFSTGFAANGEQNTVEKFQGLAEKDIRPFQLFTLLKERCQNETIFVLDEYDRINPEDALFHSSVSDFLKTLADHTVEHNIKIVIVGVSTTAVALLGKHRSIERSAREIYLRPLRADDIKYFLTEAENKLKFKFSHIIKQAIINFSHGYPYYVHLVGVEAIDAMVHRITSNFKSKDDENNRIVMEDDFIVALRKSVQRAFQSILSKYKDGVMNLTNDETNIVKALCLADDRSAWSRDELWLHGRASVGGTREHFDSLLLDLQQRRQLIRINRQNDTVRFADPLLAPFLRSWYHKSKLIPFSSTVKDVNQHQLFD